MKNFNKFERIHDIGADPNDVPAPITRDWNETVKISLTAQEVIAEIAEGIYFNYWELRQTSTRADASRSRRRYGRAHSLRPESIKFTIRTLSIFML